MPARRTSAGERRHVCSWMAAWHHVALMQIDEVVEFLAKLRVDFALLMRSAICILRLMPFCSLIKIMQSLQWQQKQHQIVAGLSFPIIPKRTWPLKARKLEGK